MTDLGNKKILAHNLQYLMDRYGIDRKELAKRLAVPYSTFSSWINCDKYPRIDKIEMIADFFNIPKSYIIERHEIPAGEKKKSIPILGSIACGLPILAEQNYDGEILLPEHIQADFALKCKGDSMVDARINDGDYVYIRQQTIVENGEIAAVLIGNEATLKKVYLDSEGLTLKPCNKKYQPMIFKGSKLRDVQIIGKAVGFVSTI